MDRQRLQSEANRLLEAHGREPVRTWLEDTGFLRQLGPMVEAGRRTEVAELLVSMEDELRDAV